MEKIVVGVAEVNAKNNPVLAELAAADLERKIAERFEDGASIKSVSCFQNDRSFHLVGVVSGEEKEVEEVEPEDEPDADDNDTDADADKTKSKKVTLKKKGGKS